MIRARFSSVALRDVAEAQAWYSERGTRLDLDLRDELDQVIERMRQHPAGFPLIRRNIRRANLRRFPYGVFYIEKVDHLLVIGVVHHARHPDLWKRRG